MSVDQVQESEDDVSAKFGTLMQAQEAIDRGDTPVKEAVESPEATETATTTEAPEDDSPTSFADLIAKAGIENEKALGLPLTIKIDGEEKAISIGEVIKGYNLSQAAYKKMEEAAHERRVFAEEQQTVRNAIGQRIQQTENLFTLAQNQLVADFQVLQGPQGAQLNQENPTEFARMWNMYNQRAAQIQSALQQVNDAKNYQAQANQAERQQALSANREKLYAIHPDWRDPKVALEAQTKMYRVAKDLGYSDADLAAIDDYRHLEVLFRAASNAEFQASAEAKVKQVRQAPQMAKPGARQVKNPRDSALTNALDRWNKSGRSDDDALAAAFEIMG